MEQLIEAMKQALANTFVLYFQAHSAHWNVEGQDFKQYHDFYSDLYTELHVAIDDLAEHMRALDVMAPKSLSEMLMNASIDPRFISTNPRDLTQDLKTGNDVCLVSLMLAFKAAEAAGEVGVADFLTQRIDTHQKHGWMLRSSLK